MTEPAVPLACDHERVRAAREGEGTAMLHFVCLACGRYTSLSATRTYVNTRKAPKK